MEIVYEILDLPNQEPRKRYLETKLNRSFGHFDFIKKVYIKFAKNGSVTTVSIQTKFERSKSVFVEHSDRNEHRAVRGAIAKMMVLIRKYRERHYHSVHKTAKGNLEEKIDNVNFHES